MPQLLDYPHPSRSRAVALGRRGCDRGDRAGPLRSSGAARSTHAFGASRPSSGIPRRSIPGRVRTACTRRRARGTRRTGPLELPRPARSFIAAIQKVDGDSGRDDNSSCFISSPRCLGVRPGPHLLLARADLPTHSPRPRVCGEGAQPADRGLRSLRSLRHSPHVNIDLNCQTAADLCCRSHALNRCAVSGKHRVVSARSP